MLICPTHVPHFPYAYRLIESMPPGEKLTLVFSSEHDRSLFSMPCDSLVAPPKPDHIESIVTHKKLWALSQVQNSTGYVALIDDETTFVQPLEPHLQSIWEGNPIVGNQSEWGAPHIRSTLQDLNVLHYPYDESLYFWFNEVPTMPADLIAPFLRWLGERPLRRDSFDYLAFGVWMILQGHKMRILDGKSELSLIEDLSRHPENHHLASEVSWSPPFAGCENFPNLKLRFHLDR